MSSVSSIRFPPNSDHVALLDDSWWRRVFILKWATRNGGIAINNWTDLVFVLKFPKSIWQWHGTIFAKLICWSVEGRHEALPNPETSSSGDMIFLGWTKLHVSLPTGHQMCITYWTSLVLIFCETSLLLLQLCNKRTIYIRTTTQFLKNHVFWTTRDFYTCKCTSLLISFTHFISKVTHLELDCFTGTGLEWILHIPLRVVRGDWMVQSFGWDRKNGGSVSQQMWHNKDPSLLKGPERRA
jgi:hypothetical protein